MFLLGLAPNNFSGKGQHSRAAGRLRPRTSQPLQKPLPHVCPISFLHFTDWNQEKPFLWRRICGFWV